MTTKQKNNWFMDCVATHIHQLTEHLAEQGASEEVKAQNINRLLATYKQYFDMFIAKGDFEKELAKRFFD